MLKFIPLLNNINKIEGWLSAEEADLLMCSVITACTQSAMPHAIVEVGSYHGKSTVVLGSVVKALFAGVKVYAIDPHNGVVTVQQNGAMVLPPSLTAFKQNIAHNDLADVVKLIADHSFNVKWDEPISLLFVDGLHDYENVSRDFRHFEPHLVPGALAAFHDCTDHFPGVKKFITELCTTGSYTEIDSAGSMVVLQKKST